MNHSDIANHKRVFYTILTKGLKAMDKKNAIIEMVNCITDKNIISSLFILVKEAYLESYYLSEQECFSAEKDST